MPALTTPPAGWEDVFRRFLWDDRTNSAPDATAEALLQFLDEEYANREVYPVPENVFRALRETPPARVRAVILGQDPYHEPGQAHGLSFSVPAGVRLPPSLRNIFKERESDLGIPAAGASGDLSAWARRGVLLLNATLTVRRGAAGSHRGHGWERFTDEILRALDARSTPMVFILWGKDARAKRRFLENPAHLVLESEHPSPLSAWRGFFGSRPFSATNAFLTAHGLPPIDWHNDA